METDQGTVRGGRPARQGKTRLGSRPGATSGFTLVETMVALTILAFGLLAMLGMMTAAMAGGQVGRHATDASRLARNKLEYFNRIGWADADMQPTGGWQTDPVATTTTTVESATGPQQEQVYTLQYRVAADPTDADLRLIDVRVTWREGNDRLVSPVRRVAMSSVRYDSP
jgi:prepilin-type N-terminal cleavage/methylation domain-containing protein